MALRRGIMASVHGAVRRFWAPTQQASILVAGSDGSWTLTALRWTARGPWSLLQFESGKPITGRDPKELLRQAHISRPDYVVPPRQIVRHLAYPSTVGRGDLARLLGLEGSRHTPFASERLTFAYRFQGPNMAGEREGVSVSYCLRDDLVALAATLGAFGPRYGFLPRFEACEGIDLLHSRWWRPWTRRGGLFLVDAAGSRTAAFYRFLMEAALMPLAAVLLIAPATLLWQGRVTQQRHEIRTEAVRLAQPLRDLRTRLHATHHLQRELAALRVYLPHAHVPEMLLPRLTQALPRSATLATLRYNALSHHLSVQIRGSAPSALVSALNRMRGSAHWREVGMAQPLRVGRYLVSLAGRWSPEDR